MSYSNDKSDRDDKSAHGERSVSSARGERSDRGPRSDRGAHGERGDKRPARRPPIRESLMDLDRDLLKQLARRTNMLQRLRDAKGRIDPKEEKELRASWEKNAGHMSRDARLVHQLFALLQEIEFNPRLTDGEERRPAFSLAPSQRAVDVRMAAPLACRRSRLYLTLAAVSGSACRITPSLLGDPAVECIKMFNQCGTSLAWEEDGTLRSREGGGLTLADKVIFVGDDSLNFHLLLGQYVGHTSRAKITGESNLKLADLSVLRRFLPQLGARMTNAVPKTDGLPVRIECSGVLPDVINIPADLSVDAVIGFAMGAPFWQRPIGFNLADHPQAALILDEATAVLKGCGADFSAQDKLLRITPGPLTVPAEPLLNMDLTLATPLLALPAFAGGQVRLTGRWPQCSVGTELLTFLKQAGADASLSSDGIFAVRGARAESTPLDGSNLPLRFAPLVLACAALPALRGQKGYMPRLPEGTDMEVAQSFLIHLRLDADAEGILQPLGPLTDEAVWTAPDPVWAMSLALCAFALPNIKLANPGVLTVLYPAFWNLYNALPCPDLKKTVTEPVHEKPVRRRIIAADQAGIGSGDSDN